MRPECIDFSGHELAGSVMFLSHFQFFRSHPPEAGRSRPTRKSTDRADFAFRDLAMGLSNQLLGRIKNQFYRQGVILEPTLPHLCLWRRNSRGCT